MVVGLEPAQTPDPELGAGSGPPAWHFDCAGMASGKGQGGAGCWQAAGNVGEGTVAGQSGGLPGSGVACLGPAAAAALLAGQSTALLRTVRYGTARRASGTHSPQTSMAVRACGSCPG